MLDPIVYFEVTVIGNGRMGKVVATATEIAHRQVFELRFAFGHLFWDRCGRILNEVLREHNDWEFEQMQAGTAVVAQRDRNLVFTCSYQKLDLSQSQSADVETLISHNDFAKLVESFSSIAIKTLELADFPRIGFRAWYLYPTASREESYDLMDRFKAFKAAEPILRSLGKATDVAYRFVVERQKHMLGIAVTPFEQRVNLPIALEVLAKAQARKAHREQQKLRLDSLRAQRLIKKYPEHGILVDLDASIEYPPFPDELSGNSFIENAVEDFETVKEIILQSV